LCRGADCHSKRARRPPIETQRITYLEVQNLLGVRAFAVDCAGQSVVTITGRNGAGKSSILDSIWMAMGGKRAIPDRPVHDGADEGHARLVTDDYEVVLTVPTDRTKAKLVVTYRGNTLKSPQAVLDSLISGICFNPLSWLALPDKDQFEALCQLARLDLTALDTERQSLYDQRTIQNREVDRLRNHAESLAGHYDDLPDELESVTALSDQINAASEAYALQERMESVCGNLLATIQVETRQYDTVEQRIEDLQAQIEALRVQNAARAETIDASQSELAEKRSKAEAHRATLRDTAPLRDRLVAAEATNDRIRARKAWSKAIADHADAKTASDDLSECLAEVDAQKTALLAAADWPIADLSVDSAGRKVLYRNRPLTQASQAERLRVAIGIGFALRPDLRVVTVHDASLLDDEGMALIAQLAAEHDGQVWLERVGSGDLRVEFTTDEPVGTLLAAPDDDPPTSVPLHLDHDQIEREKYANHQPSLFDAT